MVERRVGTKKEMFDQGANLLVFSDGQSGGSPHDWLRGVNWRRLDDDWTLPQVLRKSAHSPTTLRGFGSPNSALSAAASPAGSQARTGISKTARASSRVRIVGSNRSAVNAAPIANAQDPPNESRK